MNKVVLTGRITKDPEIRYTQSGMPNLRFSLAVDRQTRDAQGNRTADFISCVAFFFVRSGAVSSFSMASAARRCS